MPSLYTDLLLPLITNHTPEIDTMDNLLNMIRYFSFIVVEGDWANDWLTHLDIAIQPTVLEMGKAIATLFGF